MHRETRGVVEDLHAGIRKLRRRSRRLRHRPDALKQLMHELGSSEPAILAEFLASRIRAGSHFFEHKCSKPTQIWIERQLPCRVNQRFSTNVTLVMARHKLVVTLIKRDDTDMPRLGETFGKAFKAERHQT